MGNGRHQKVGPYGRSLRAQGPRWLSIEMEVAPPTAELLTHCPTKRTNGTAELFCQLQVLAMEPDDACKSRNCRGGLRWFRFPIGATLS